MKNFMGNRDCDHFQVHGSVMSGLRDVHYMRNAVRPYITVLSPFNEYPALSISRQLHGVCPLSNRTLAKQSVVGVNVEMLSSPWPYSWPGGSAMVRHGDRFAIMEVAVCNSHYSTTTGRAHYGVHLYAGISLFRFSSYQGRQVPRALTDSSFLQNLVVHPPTIEGLIPQYMVWAETRGLFYDIMFSYRYPVGDSSKDYESQVAFIANNRATLQDFATGTLNLLKRLAIQRLSLATDFSARDYLLITNQRLNPFFGLKSSDFLKLKTDLRGAADLCRPEVDLKSELSTVTQMAVESCNSFEGNTATLIKEIFEIKDSIIGLKKLLSGKVSPKNISSLWLNLRYGLRLTASDSAELACQVANAVSAVQADLYTTCRGRHKTDNSVVCCKLYVDQDRASLFAQAMSTMYEWDLFPSLSNVWDIIPYSFVVDWFVDVEGFLSAIDANTHRSVLEIFSCLYSTRLDWGWDRNMFSDWCGPVSFSDYHRYSTKEPEPIIPTFSGGSFQPKNLLDGLSLIIQRL